VFLLIIEKNTAFFVGRKQYRVKAGTVDVFLEALALVLPFSSWLRSWLGYSYAWVLATCVQTGESSQSAKIRRELCVCGGQRDVSELVRARQHAVFAQK
jgi:hypothetical protein